MMCTKAVWLIAALMDLVWVGGVAEGWLAGTRELRLSVASGAWGVAQGEHRLEACATGRGKAALGVVRGDGTHGTDRTHRGLGPQPKDQKTWGWTRYRPSYGEGRSPRARWLCAHLACLRKPNQGLGLVCPAPRFLCAAQRF